MSLETVILTSNITTTSIGASYIITTIQETSKILPIVSEYSKYFSNITGDSLLSVERE